MVSTSRLMSGTPGQFALPCMTPTMLRWTPGCATRVPNANHPFADSSPERCNALDSSASHVRVALLWHEHGVNDVDHAVLGLYVGLDDFRIADLHTGRGIDGELLSL